MVTLALLALWAAPALPAGAAPALPFPPPFAPTLARYQDPDPPDPAEVEAMVEELEAAFKKGSTAEKISAVQKAVDVVDAKVVKELAGGLKDKELGVRLEVIDALGHMRHPDSLEALQRLLKKDKKKLRKDEETLPRLLKEIGRHGHKSSIPLLLDDVQGQMSQATIKARLFGLGNTRDVESIEGLLELMKRVGFIEMYIYAGDFQVAMMALTGVDRGRDYDAYSAWWRDNEKTFELPETLPDLPPVEWTIWREYWDLPERETEDEAGG